MLASLDAVASHLRVFERGSVVECHHPGTNMDIGIMSSLGGTPIIAIAQPQLAAQTEPCSVALMQKPRVRHRTRVLWAICGIFQG
jgi:hypothetical protein